MDILGHLDTFRGNFEVFAIVITAILTLLGTFSTFAAKRVGERAAEARTRELIIIRHKAEAIEQQLGGKKSPPKTPLSVARDRVIVRLEEAAALRAQQRTVERWSKIAANFLTIAQYIIGGVLASSFVQENLTPNWVGALGVLVLIASLFKQQFHPEINADAARRKALRLQSLIRSSEDQLAILDAKAALGQDDSDAMIALMTLITGTIIEIENSESSDGTNPMTAS